MMLVVWRQLVWVALEPQVQLSEHLVLGSALLSDPPRWLQQSQIIQGECPWLVCSWVHATSAAERSCGVPIHAQHGWSSVIATQSSGQLVWGVSTPCPGRARIFVEPHLLVALQATGLPRQKETRLNAGPRNVFQVPRSSYGPTPP